MKLNDITDLSDLSLSDLSLPDLPSLDDLPAVHADDLVERAKGAVAVIRKVPVDRASVVKWALVGAGTAAVAYVAYRGYRRWRSDDLDTADEQLRRVA